MDPQLQPRPPHPVTVNLHWVRVLNQLPHRPLSSTYDAEADVLYLNCAKPSYSADSELTDDDIIVRFDGDEVVGYTILHASQRDDFHTFQVIIAWSEEDRAFVAEVPELAGCMAHGETKQEALAQVHAAMILWLDSAAEVGDPIAADPTAYPSSERAGDPQAVAASPE